jgi:Holliday junction resolvasome RuvABC endonuclease subunit
MVRAMLNINETMPADAADAVAVALCHANTRLPQNL